MTREQAKAVIAAVMAHYPGIALDQANENAYVNALLSLPPKPAMRAALEVARREERFPSVAALLRAIGEVLCDAPSAAEAWEEVKASFDRHYCYPLYCDWGGWEPSHPLIARTVDALGYHRLMAGANPSADQAQFRARYEEYRLEAARRAGRGELPTPLAPRQLAQGAEADEPHDDAPAPHADALARLRAATAEALRAETTETDLEAS